MASAIKIVTVMNASHPAQLLDLVSSFMTLRFLSGSAETRLGPSGGGWVGG